MYHSIPDSDHPLIPQQQATRKSWGWKPILAFVAVMAVVGYVGSNGLYRSELSETMVGQPYKDRETQLFKDLGVTITAVKYFNAVQELADAISKEPDAAKKAKYKTEFEFVGTTRHDFSTQLAADWKADGSWDTMKAGKTDEAKAQLKEWRNHCASFKQWEDLAGKITAQSMGETNVGPACDDTCKECADVKKEEATDQFAKAGRASNV